MRLSIQEVTEVKHLTQDSLLVRGRVSMRISPEAWIQTSQILFEFFLGCLVTTHHFTYSSGSMVWNTKEKTEKFSCNLSHIPTTFRSHGKLSSMTNSQRIISNHVSKCFGYQEWFACEKVGGFAAFHVFAVMEIHFMAIYSIEVMPPPRSFSHTKTDEPNLKTWFQKCHFPA